MTKRRFLTAGMLALALISTLFHGSSLLQAADPAPAKARQDLFKGVLLTPELASSKNLKKYSRDGYNAAILYLDDRNAVEDNEKAVQRIKSSGMELYYWIEVARNAALADAHPEWMGSIQGHDGWRRKFPKVGQPSAGQVVKAYPWVPVLSKEAFDVQKERVEVMLELLPLPHGIFLNDLQGAPSASGCGNSSCRYTLDNGPVTTSTRLPDDAAARFVAAVAKIMPKAEVIPVWTTECADKDAGCHGADCFAGPCWREYAAQLDQISVRARHLGVLLSLNGSDASSPHSPNLGEWQKAALSSFKDVVPAKGGREVAADKLIAVIQGWEVNDQQVQAQIGHSREAGAAGYVLAVAKIDQAWEPRLVNFPAKEDKAAK